MASEDRFCFYSNGKPVIEPSLYSKPLGPKDAVMCYHSEWYEMLLDSFRFREGRDMPRFPGLVAGKRNDRVAVCHSSFGAPAAGMLLEKLVASGINRVLMLGLAGSICSDCALGTVFVPTRGIREEGTSYHYLRAETEVKPSEHLQKLIRDGLKGTSYMEGGVWSTDAPYRETRGKVLKFSGKGVKAVEMECTALMAIAQYRKIEFGAILVISDELFGKSWREGFDSIEVKNSQTALSETAARILN